jgi:hypothetical protein
MIDGRIVRIFDDHTVALNIGSSQGVEPGMRFGIFTPYEDIVDPETGVNLGQTRRRKAVVQANTVHPRFTVATTPVYRVQTRTTGIPSFTTSEVEERRDPLPVARGETQPFESGDQVRVGDRVEQLVESKTPAKSGS